MIDVRHAILPIAGFITALVTSTCNQGCKPAMTAAEAQAAYTAELVSCVTNAVTMSDKCKETAKTGDESRACERKAESTIQPCKDEVNKKWHLCVKEEWPRIGPCD